MDYWGDSRSRGEAEKEYRMEQIKESLNRRPICNVDNWIIDPVWGCVYVGEAHEDSMELMELTDRGYEGLRAGTKVTYQRNETNMFTVNDKL